MHSQINPQPLLNPERGRLIRCDFCGLEFDPNCQLTTCSSCPMARNCAHYTCPRCGYPILPEAKLTGWIRQIKNQLLRRKA